MFRDSVGYMYVFTMHVHMIDGGRVHSRHPRGVWTSCFGIGPPLALAARARLHLCHVVLHYLTCLFVDIVIMLYCMFVKIYCVLYHPVVTVVRIIALLTLGHVYVLPKQRGLYVYNNVYNNSTTNNTTNP